MDVFLLQYIESGRSGLFQGFPFEICKNPLLSTFQIFYLSIFFLLDPIDIKKTSKINNYEIHMHYQRC